MIDVRKGLFAGLLALLVVGCSSPEPQEIDIDEVAAEAGLSKDDYTVHDNGAIEIKSKADTNDNTQSGEPLAMQGEDWQYIVNNGIRTADEYAVENNPASTFTGNNVQTSLVKQYGGKYEGEYLLTVLNDNKGSVSYAQLRPLFNINASSDGLDDESKLWEVTIAKYNGKEY